MSGGERFAEWAILELMGHRKLAGYVQDVEAFGGRMLRIDVPSEPPATQFYGAASIYCVTPTTEETARAFAQRGGPAPVQRWELLPPAATTTDAFPSDGDEDDGEEDLF